MWLVVKIGLPILVWELSRFALFAHRYMTGPHVHYVDSLIRFPWPEENIPSFDNYTLAELSELTPLDRAVALRQVDEDKKNFRSNPIVEFGQEYVEIDGEHRWIRLNSTMSRRAFSNLFTVFPLPGSTEELVIKYQTSSGFGTVHPLVREWGFFAALAGLGITPRALFLSPPSRVTVEGTPKTSFQNPFWTAEIRAKAPRLDVRYLLMTRAAGGAVESLISATTPVSLDEALRISLGTIESMRIMHAAGVIHGDMHTGNIVRLGEGVVGFIDFGLASFVADADARPDMRNATWWRQDWKMSHWQLLKYRDAPRDDMFMVLINLALMVMGPRFATAVGTRLSETALLQLWKEGFMFCLPAESDGCGWMHSVRDGGVEALKDRLWAVLRLVRGLEGINDPLPYDELIAALAGIQEWIAGPDPKANGSAGFAP